jgi:hypothetical protein
MRPPGLRAWRLPLHRHFRWAKTPKRNVIQVTFAKVKFQAGSQAHDATGRMGGNVTRPRTADDFATMRARLDDPRREREAMQATGRRVAVGPADAAHVLRAGPITSTSEYDR